MLAPRHSVGIARTRGEHQLPEARWFIPVAALFGQDGEVAQSEMAIDALVDAAKLVGTLQGQDPPPAGSGLVGMAGFAMQDGLAEMQLGGGGVEPQVLAAAPRSSARTATQSKIQNLNSLS